MGTLTRLALTIGAVTLFAGCGGSLPPIGAPGATQQAGTERASSFRLLHSFGAAKDGETPEAGLIDVKGTLYGTTESGGADNEGTVFSVTTSGKEKVLHSFGAGNDGRSPEAGLLDVKGKLYGTTEIGGTHNEGIVFGVSTSGKEKVLHSFGTSSDDGRYPQAGLLDVKGTLYGTTYYGGTQGAGTVFSITAAGTEKVLHSFGSGSDGTNPQAGLIDVNGTLYGTTYKGGTHGPGTVFSIKTTGTEKVLHSFSGSDGANPEAGLLDVNGMLYGTTYDGGYDGYGTVFRVSTSGTERVAYSFGAASYDGSGPEAGLIDVKSVLYGTTYYGGGADDKGTIFSITTAGKEKVLYSFPSASSDGESPEAGLLDVNGTLYSTTEAGGTYSEGTVFAFTP
jgi:uncharacterized repeat protein (TIGR03803 family)